MSQDLPRIYLETYGCQMNEADTEVVRALLVQQGFELTELAQADLVLINTCTVRDSSDRRELNRVLFLKHERPMLLVGILGCLAASRQAELLNPKLGIDLLAGPDNYQALPELIREVWQAKRPVSQVSFAAEDYSTIYPLRTSRLSAKIPIMRGCDNYCAYCVVPYTRGRERSRAAHEVLAEVQQLIQDGYREVVLLGQNVNSYRSGTLDFTGLLAQISALPGLPRIRFMAPHPKDLSPALLQLMQERPHICQHIHLPLQSGSTRILQLMNRPYTQADYLALVATIRQALPQVVVTTDVIVGFPGETEEDFLATKAVMEEVGFDVAFIFKYSPRPQTLAAEKYPDDVAPAVKTQRIMLLNELQQKRALAKNQALIGQIVEILIESNHPKKNVPASQGRTAGNKLVVVLQELALGALVSVRITAATPHALRGESV